jgi:hypothetical protein
LIWPKAYPCNYRPNQFKKKRKNRESIDDLEVKVNKLIILIYLPRGRVPYLDGNRSHLYKIY